MSTVAVPKKKQDMITEYIFDFIKQNHLVDGDKLPTERELSEMLQVSRTTTQKVFRDLELKGVVYKRQGSGIFLGDKGRQNGKVDFISYIKVDKGESENISQFFQIIQGAEEYLTEQGCYLTVHTVSNQNDNIYDKVCELIGNKVKGVIFNSDIRMDAVTYFRLLKKNCAMVFADCSPLGVNANFVSSDNLRGGYLATRHIIDIGCRRIGYVGGGEERIRSLSDRFLGYKTALQEACMPIRQEFLCMDYVEHHPNQFVEFIDEYLERVLSLPEPIDGLFVRNDITAIAVENALLKRGVRVPEQVAIVGFDNLDISEVQKVPLSSISQDFYLMGKEAAKMCLHLAAGGSSVVTQILSPVRLVARNSTARG